MKKTIMEKLGLEPVRRLNRSICLERVSFLRSRIERKKIKPALLPHARYYANWYSWMAKNGGTRSERRSA